jgi:hypothetical protein
MLHSPQPGSSLLGSSILTLGSDFLSPPGPGFLAGLEALGVTLLHAPQNMEVFELGTWRVRTGCIERSRPPEAESQSVLRRVTCIPVSSGMAG